MSFLPGMMPGWNKASGVSAEVAQFLARAGALDATHVNAYTALIDGLVADGLWSLLDCLYIFATDTKANAKLNLKSSSFPVVENGTVSFTADQGFTLSLASTTNYLLPQFNPSTAGGNFAQNSAHQSIWSNTNAQATPASIGAGATGTFDSLMTIRTPGDQFVAKINNVRTGANGISVANTNSVGHFLVSRTGATALESYKNAVSQGSNADPSVAPGNAYHAVGGRTFDGSVQASGHQYSAATFGGGLNGAQVTALYSRIAAYRSAAGL